MHDARRRACNVVGGVYVYVCVYYVGRYRRTGWGGSHGRAAGARQADRPAGQTTSAWSRQARYGRAWEREGGVDLDLHLDLHIRSRRVRVGEASPTATAVQGMATTAMRPSYRNPPLLTNSCCKRSAAGACVGRAGQRLRIGQADPCKRRIPQSLLPVARPRRICTA